MPDVGVALVLDGVVGADVFGVEGADVFFGVEELEAGEPGAVDVGTSVAAEPLVFALVSQAETASTKRTARPSTTRRRNQYTRRGSGPEGFSTVLTRPR